MRVCCVTAAVLEEHYNPRLIKQLLQDLSGSVTALTKGVGKCVLVGSISVWLLRLDTIQHWQRQLNNLHIPKVREGSEPRQHQAPQGVSRRLLVGTNG